MSTRQWHRVARIVAVALFLLFVPPAIAMTIQGEHGGSNNALAVPLSYCAMLWLLDVPVSERSRR